MTVDEAYTEIEVLTQATTEPVLTNAELNLLVRKAKRADSASRPPSDNLWVPTFNISFAVGMGWELKAMKVATAVDVQSADQKLTRSQLYAQLMKVSVGWKSKAAESIILPGSLRRRSTLPSINSDETWPWQPWPFDGYDMWVPSNTSDF